LNYVVWFMSAEKALIAGYPHPEIEKGMESEHCEISLGCDVEFTTTNYGIQTTPIREYDIARNVQECPPSDLMDKTKTNVVRIIKDLEDLHKSSLALQAELMRLEVLSIVSVLIRIFLCNLH